MGMTIKRLELRNFQAIKDFSAGFTGDVYLVARYRSIENNNIALVKTCDMFRAKNAKLKERINEMVESRREFLDV